jgi:CDP-diacylglycerol--glycerol-3-phosphate 3-phosphatidyltransferase
VTPEVGLWNVANVLTMARVVLVPVFVACLLAGGTAWRLVALAIFCLASLTDLLGELPWWVTGVIMFREIGVTVLRLVVIRRGVIAASRGGKAKTMLQVIAICLYVLPGSLSPPGIIRGLVMAAAVAVTVVTGVDYVFQAMRLRRPVPEPASRSDLGEA